MRHRWLLVCTVLLAIPAPSLAAPAVRPPSRLLGVGWAAQGGATKVVIVLDRLARHQISMQGSRIVVDLWPARLRGQPHVLWAGVGPVGRVRVAQPLAEMVRVGVELRRRARYKVFADPATGRLALVLVPPWMGAVPVPPSVAHEVIRVQTGGGRATVHVLTVDTRDPRLEVRAVLAGGRVRGMEPTSVVAHRHDGVAAVNGGFFAGPFPLGLVVVDGRLVSAPLDRRSVLAFTADGPVIRDFAFRAEIRPLAGEAKRIRTVNRPPRTGAIAAYTDAFGAWVHPQARRMHVVIEHGVVSGHSTSGAMIPPGGVVLSLPLSLRSWTSRYLDRGQPAEVVWRLSPDLLVRGAIGGGPRLVKDGRSFVPYDWEAFPPAVYTARAPRTAVGITRAGKLVFVTVDGRSRRSAGMTLGELADLMVRLGARDAMNLDGGGSATMVVGGRVMNEPSDGRERGVASAIVVVRRQPATTARR